MPRPRTNPCPSGAAAPRSTRTSEISRLHVEPTHSRLIVVPTRYHGRPSYHPILARVAETDSVCGALLRPGDTSFGNDDVATVVAV